MEPIYRIPSWMQVTSMVKSATCSEKEFVECFMKGSTFVVFTDSWTSKAVKSFAIHIVHFIDDNWSLQSYVLASLMVDGRYIVENIKEHLCTVGKGFVQLERCLVLY